MDDNKKHTITTRFSAAKLALLVVILIVSTGTLALAQNTKGDKPATQNPIRLFPKIKSKTKGGGDRANTRDISGRRRIRTKNASSANRVIYSNGPGTRARSVSAKRAKNNVFPQKGPYVHNVSPKPKTPKIYNKTASNKPITKRIPQSRQRAWTSNLKGGPIGAPTASRPFVTRGRKNVYWGKFSKGERPITRDLTGRPVRTRNFHSSPLGTGRSDTVKTANRRPGKEGAGFGKIRSGYKSISGRNGRAWQGDISGRAIRTRSGQTRGRGIFSGVRSASGKGKSNLPIPVRQPGIGANGLSKLFGRRGGSKVIGVAGGMDGYRGNILKGDVLKSPAFGGGFAGNIKTRRPYKGGGSVSGRYLGGSALPVRRPGAGFDAGGYRGNILKGDVLKSPAFGGGYAGNIKTRRPYKGGGSVSGQFFNNGGSPLPARRPGAGSLGAGGYRGNFLREDFSKGINRDGSGFAGNIKTKRPFKGGGSVSGKFLSNDGKPIVVRPPGPGSRGIGNFRGGINKDELSPDLNGGIARYSGTVKYQRPLKGGGSVSGKFMSHDGKPLAVRPPGQGSRGIGKFQGFVKAQRPEKGGGSVSGQLWNNNEKPLTVRPPVSTDANGYAGNTRLSRFRRHYIKNPNANELALKKVRPSENTYAIGSLTVRRKTPPYVKNPNSNDLALKKVKPSENTYAIGALTVKRKMPQYVKNPSSNKAALKTIDPGKAYAQLKDYQGNIKMKKFTGDRMHPDSQFAHGNKDNVKSERSITTNIKLFWAKIFKKSGGQPEIVKEKAPVPRYDKKEKELWKALYD